MTATASGLRITNDRHGRRRVLSARGRIDHATAPTLGWVLSRAVGDGPVALDLGEAEVTDDSGTVLLLNAMRRLYARQRELIVVCPQPSLRRALDRTGLARRFELLGDADALRASTPISAVARADDPEASRVAVGRRGQRPSTASNRAALLADATLAIDRRHGEYDLTLDDIAREISTSNRQLQRVFAELAASAFRDELGAVRMQHGADLLQSTDLAVSLVARRVGYRHSAQFAKAFRRYHGVSPTSFRRASAKRARTGATGSAGAVQIARPAAT